MTIAAAGPEEMELRRQREAQLDHDDDDGFFMCAVSVQHKVSERCTVIRLEVWY